MSGSSVVDVSVLLCEIQERLSRALDRAEILALVGPEECSVPTWLKWQDGLLTPGDRRDDST